MTWTSLHRLNVPGYIKRTEREAEEQKKARAARDKIKEWKNNRGNGRKSEERWRGKDLIWKRCRGHRRKE